MTTTADRPEATAPSVVPALADTVPAPRAPSGTEIVHGPGEFLVAVRGVPGRRTVPGLSCRLHEAIGAATAGDVLTVDLGVASAADPAIERILVCARESATARGVTFRLL